MSEEFLTNEGLERLKQARINHLFIQFGLELLNDLEARYRNNSTTPLEPNDNIRKQQMELLSIELERRKEDQRHQQRMHEAKLENNHLLRWAGYNGVAVILIASLSLSMNSVFIMFLGAPAGGVLQMLYAKSKIELIKEDRKRRNPNFFDPKQ